MYLCMHQEFEGLEEASLASFFRHLSVGGVARPVDTLLMAGLILYGSGPFEKAVKSKTKQLAYVFQVWPKTNLAISGAPIRKHLLLLSLRETSVLATHWCFEG